MIDMASVHQFRHLPVEEGEEQGANMRTVHVRVGHDDNAVITQFFMPSIHPCRCLYPKQRSALQFPGMLPVGQIRARSTLRIFPFSGR